MSESNRKFSQDATLRPVKGSVILTFLDLTPRPLILEKNNGFHSEFNKFNELMGSLPTTLIKLAKTAFRNKSEESCSVTKTAILKKYQIC